MNLRRGLFRLWIVFAVLFVIAVAAVSFEPIKKEFSEARLKRETHPGSLMVPFDCSLARGVDGTDYVRNLDPSAEPACWYRSARFRELYSEYAIRSDDELSKQQYPKFGLDLEYLAPSPWRAVFIAVGIAFGIPALALVLGVVFGWAGAGFQNGKSN
jgi:hypothetical protein